MNTSQAYFSSADYARAARLKAEERHADRVATKARKLRRHAARSFKVAQRVPE